MEKEIKPILPAPGEEEIWVECNDYPAYEVSSFGKVRNKQTQKLMTPKYSNSGGYAQIHLRIGIKHENGKYETIHRLVAKAFCHNNDPEKHYMVDHIDRDRKNNYYKNLRWVTPKGNCQNRKKKYNTYIYKNRTPLVLLNEETNELIQEFACPIEAGQLLQLSAKVIVESIHNERLCLKVGKFMTKIDYEKMLEKESDRT